MLSQEPSVVTNSIVVRIRTILTSLIDSTTAKDQITKVTKVASNLIPVAEYSSSSDPALEIKSVTDKIVAT